MSLEALIELGYSPSEAQKLENSPYFRRNKNIANKLTHFIAPIAELYGISQEKVKQAILKHPPFAGYNHERVIQEATNNYKDEKKVKQAILKFPPFAGYNHERVIQEATNNYKDEKKVKQAILKFPQFAGYNHERVIQEATNNYKDEKKVKQAILKHPQFASLDHERVIQEATNNYKDEKKVKQAILKHPQFASLNHERVVQQKSRLGRLVGLSKEQIIDKILENPVLAGYSATRYIAGLDVGRQLKKEGFEQDKKMLKTFMNYVGSSPYAPEYSRKRISQVPGGKEPPLLTKMRNSLSK